MGSHGWKTFISLWAILLSLNVERTWEMGPFPAGQAADQVPSFLRVQLHCLSQDFQSLEQEDREETSAGSKVLLKRP